jgi:hypothetical protein
VKRIEIFKPGKHTAMNGAVLNFSESDLAASAAAYDPAKHEAPLVIGHPKHDDPAYGWVKSMSFADGLDAEPHQVDPAFAEMVGRGAFKKVSASFYTPDSPQNPVPGIYYLRHVGFLGAQPPAVKGLRAPEFAENEEGVIEFADWSDMQNASLWRRMREWIIGRFGLDEADKIIPDYAVGALEDDARQEAADEPTPQFSEPSPKGDDMSAEDKARLTALEEENTRLKAEGATRAGAERHAAHASFAEGLMQAGKLLPAQKDVCVATLDFFAGQDTEVSFGEGDAKKPLVDGFKEFLSALPKQVEFSEVAKPENGGGATASIAAPPGYTVDAAGAETHAKALSYQEAHEGVDYITAVKAVSAS